MCLGGLYLEGRFNGGFFALCVWGAYIWRADTWRGFFSSCLRGYDQACESQGVSCSVVISKINMKSALFFALGVFAVFQTG